MAPVALAVCLLSACATPTRRAAVPPDLSTEAMVTGFNYRVRYFPRDSGHLKKFGLRRIVEARGGLPEVAGTLRPAPPAAYLAISGGGDNGAFRAGFLAGWSKAGTRPEFKLVTGIGTGALIAPFAFLGPDWDAKLKHVYTEVSLKDIAVQKPLFSVLYGDSMADTGR